MKPLFATCRTGSTFFGIALCSLLSVGACLGAEDVIKKSFEAQPGSLLIMDVDRGSIDITPSDRSQVEIQVVRKLDRVSSTKAAEIFARHEVTFAQTGREIRVEGIFRDKPRLLSKDNHLQINYTVLVPRQFDLDLNTRAGGVVVGDLAGQMKAKSAAGSLRFGNIDGPVRAQTAAGSISVKRAKTATLETAAGGIHVGEIEGDVAARSDAGAIEIRKAQGQVTAKTAAGHIEIGGAPGPVLAETHSGGIQGTLTGQPKGDCRFVTSAGSIRLAVPANMAADLEARTGAGHVDSELPVTVVGKLSKSSVVGKLNGGGPKLFVHTGAGSISLKKASALAAEKE